MTRCLGDVQLDTLHRGPSLGPLDVKCTGRLQGETSMSPCTCRRLVYSRGYAVLRSTPGAVVLQKSYDSYHKQQESGVCLIPLLSYDQLYHPATAYFRVSVSPCPRWPRPLLHFCCLRQNSLRQKSQYLAFSFVEIIKGIRASTSVFISSARNNY